jgi:hypothetical protein
MLEDGSTASPRNGAYIRYTSDSVQRYVDILAEILVIRMGYGCFLYQYHIIQDEPYNIITWNNSFIIHRIRKCFRQNMRGLKGHIIREIRFLSCVLLQDIKVNFVFLNRT